jgi:hypothetical protein
MLKKKTVVLIIACIVISGLFNPVSAQNTQEDSLLLIIEKSIKNREAIYAKEGLISLGIDINSLALDHESFEAYSRAQSGYVEDYKVEIIDHRIILNDTFNEARYFVKYKTSFYVDPFRYHIDETWETGIMKKEDNHWVIYQQHASVPIKNEVWPAYLAKEKKQYIPNSQFSTDELLEDFDLLTLALEQAHGRLNRFFPFNEYKKEVDNIKRQLETPKTELEFYNLICPIFSSIKCGHTRISLSENTIKSLDNQKIFIPVQLKFINGKAFVLNSINEEKLEKGVEVLSINNRKMDEIISGIFAKIISDGGIVSAKYKKLDERFHEFYYYYIEQADKYTIQYTSNKKGHPETSTLDAITNIDWRNNFNIYYNQSDELLKLTIPDNSDIAVLTIRKFVSQEINSIYGSLTNFLDSAFLEIKNREIKHLIIDLRGNGGGDIAHELYAYVVDKPVKYCKKINTPNTRYSFLEYTDKGVFFNAIHPDLWKKSRNSEGLYELPGSDNMLVYPNNLVFRDSIYILTDGNTFSAASSFSAILDDLDRATFFGEETGGCIYGSNAYDYINLTLLNTQIKVTIPIRNGLNNISEKNNLNRGVIPDFEIHNTIFDILNNKDSEMEFVFDHIARRN